MKWLFGFIDRICVVASALIFMQLPVFMQQYQLRLSGHIEELQLQVENMRKLASSSGNTIQQFIQKFISSQDVDFSRQGELMSNMVSRLNDLNLSYSSLENSSLLMRPFQFVLHLNYSIAIETFHSFEAGLLFSYETICYAVLGMGVGYLICFSISRLLFIIAPKRMQVKV